tara:strand:+ start:1149 stop:2078 length:930 start_codon:yes stop_codon:yes gene_type:complete
MHKINGTYCAVLTPINSDFSINKKLYLEHCNNLLTEGLDGIGIFGTTGEANSFNIEEKIEAINFLIDHNIDPGKIISGTGKCSIKDTVKLTKHAAKLRVKAVLVLPPFYYKNVEEEGVVEYFKKIIEEVGDNSLKYLLYNIPQISGISISTEIIEKLINLYPDNFVGMKDSSGDINKMLKIIKSFNNFSLFSGSDILAQEVCKQGGAGAITATSNISGKLISYIINNYNNESNINNFQEFQDLQVKIRNTLFSNEPISILKAFLSVKHNEASWNKVLPPLSAINNPKNNKIIIDLIELIKKMEDLLSHS